MNQIIERGLPAMKPIDPAGRNPGIGTSTGSTKARKPKPSVHSRKKVGDAATTRIGISHLPSVTKAQLKQEGWAGIITQVANVPALVVPGHLRDEAVILSAEMYELLVRLATGDLNGEIDSDEIEKALLLARVQATWDDRLAVLKDGKVLEAVENSPPRQGKIKPGPVF